MGYTYAISGLRDKRARLAGQIETAERKIAKDRESLAALDATLRLFHPEADPSHITSIRPVWRGIYFRPGERPRLRLEALRDAGKPLPAPHIAEYLMRAKAMDVSDRPLRAVVAGFMGSVLARLERQGLVRKIITAPDVWWELASGGKEE
jgi:hypothetical protein